MRIKKSIIKLLCIFSCVGLMFISGCGNNNNLNSTSKIHNPENTSEFVRIVDENGNHGFRNRDGEILISCEYDYVYPFINEYAIVKDHDLFGIIDKQGEMVIYGYKNIEWFSDKLVKCTKIDDRTTDPVVELYNVEEGSLPMGGGPYCKLSDLDNGKTLVCREYDHQWMFLDETGFPINEIDLDVGHYQDADFQSGITMLPDENVEFYGGINDAGKIILPFEYEYIQSSGKNDLLIAYKDEKGGFVDSKGQIIMDFTYDRVNKFSDELSMVHKDSKIGFVNATGDLVIDVQYDEDYDFIENMSFSEELAAVKQNGKWGYINKSGEEVIPFQFDVAYPFLDGSAYIEKDGVSYYIDKKGEYIS